MDLAVRDLNLIKNLYIYMQTPDNKRETNIYICILYLNENVVISSFALHDSWVILFSHVLWFIKYNIIIGLKVLSFY